MLNKMLNYYMKLSKYKFALMVACLVLIAIMFQWIDYLVNNQYITSNFAEGLRDRGSSDTSHTVDIPLTTTSSCTNKCGPTARCYKTGHQCTSDIDCPGCQPNVPPLNSNTKEIPGNNAAGKLTFGSTPRYSELTTDIGTQARLITDDKFSKPLSPDLGRNTWIKDFNKDNAEFKNEFTPPQSKYMPTYDKRYSLSGEFVDNGPLPSNAYFS
jgi:hypothetical protein